jgi:anti-sigma factor RsiW
MSHDNCQPWRDAFLDLADGRLGADEARRLHDEIASCAACQRAWQAWEQDDRALASALRAEVAQADIAGPVLAIIRRRQREPVRRFSRPLLVRLAAAAVLLLAVGGVFLLTRGGPPRVGTVEATSGRPTTVRPGTHEATLASQAAAVLDGAVWRTGSGDEVRIQLNDGSRLLVKPGADVRLHGTASQCALANRLPHVCLRKGEVELDLKSTSIYRAIGTPLGTAMAEQARFAVAYEPNAKTTVRVLSGRVVFSCPAREVVAWPGSTWVVEAGVGIPRLVSNDN